MTPDNEGNYECYRSCFSITKFKVEYILADLNTVLKLISPLEEGGLNGSLIPADLNSDILEIMKDYQKPTLVQTSKKLEEYIMKHFPNSHPIRALFLPTIIAIYYSEKKENEIKNILKELDVLCQIIPSIKLFDQVFRLYKFILKMNFIIPEELKNMITKFGLSNEEILAKISTLEI